jgi:hypothetical protein
MAEIYFFAKDYMASDFFGDSLDGLLSSAQDDEDFDPSDLIPNTWIMGPEICLP